MQSGGTCNAASSSVEANFVHFAAPPLPFIVKLTKSSSHGQHAWQLNAAGSTNCVLVKLSISKRPLFLHLLLKRECGAYILAIFTMLHEHVVCHQHLYCLMRLHFRWRYLATLTGHQTIPVGNRSTWQQFVAGFQQVRSEIDPFVSLGPPDIL